MAKTKKKATVAGDCINYFNSNVEIKEKALKQAVSFLTNISFPNHLFQDGVEESEAISKIIAYYDTSYEKQYNGEVDQDTNSIKKNIEKHIKSLFSFKDIILANKNNPKEIFKEAQKMINDGASRGLIAQAFVQHWQKETEVSLGKEDAENFISYLSSSLDLPSKAANVINKTKDVKEIIRELSELKDKSKKKIDILQDVAKNKKNFTEEEANAFYKFAISLTLVADYDKEKADMASGFVQYAKNDNGEDYFSQEEIELWTKYVSESSLIAPILQNFGNGLMPDSFKTFFAEYLHTHSKALLIKNKINDIIKNITGKNFPIDKNETLLDFIKKKNEASGVVQPQMVYFMGQPTSATPSPDTLIAETVSNSMEMIETVREGAEALERITRTYQIATAEEVTDNNDGTVTINGQKYTRASKLVEAIFPFSPEVYTLRLVPKVFRIDYSNKAVVASETIKNLLKEHELHVQTATIDKKENKAYADALQNAFGQTYSNIVEELVQKQKDLFASKTNIQNISFEDVYAHLKKEVKNKIIDSFRKNGLTEDEANEIFPKYISSVFAELNANIASYNAGQLFETYSQFKIQETLKNNKYNINFKGKEITSSPDKFDVFKAGVLSSMKYPSHLLDKINWSDIKQKIENGEEFASEEMLTGVDKDSAEIMNEFIEDLDNAIIYSKQALNEAESAAVNFEEMLQAKGIEQSKTVDVYFNARIYSEYKKQIPSKGKNASAQVKSYFVAGEPDILVVFPDDSVEIVEIKTRINKPLDQKLSAKNLMSAIPTVREKHITQTRIYNQIIANTMPDKNVKSRIYAFGAIDTGGNKNDFVITGDKADIYDSVDITTFFEWEQQMDANKINQDIDSKEFTEEALENEGVDESEKKIRTFEELFFNTEALNNQQLTFSEFQEISKIVKNTPEKIKLTEKDNSLIMTVDIVSGKTSKTIEIGKFSGKKNQLPIVKNMLNDGITTLMSFRGFIDDEADAVTDTGTFVEQAKQAIAKKLKIDVKNLKASFEPSTSSLKITHNGTLLFHQRLIKPTLDTEKSKAKTDILKSLNTASEFFKRAYSLATTKIEKEANDAVEKGVFENDSDKEVYIKNRKTQAARDIHALFFYASDASAKKRDNNYLNITGESADSVQWEDLSSAKKTMKKFLLENIHVVEKLSFNNATMEQSNPTTIRDLFWFYMKEDKKETETKDGQQKEIISRPFLQIKTGYAKAWEVVPETELNLFDKIKDSINANPEKYYAFEDLVKYVKDSNGTIKVVFTGTIKDKFKRENNNLVLFSNNIYLKKKNEINKVLGAEDYVQLIESDELNFIIDEFKNTNPYNYTFNKTETILLQQKSKIEKAKQILEGKQFNIPETEIDKNFAYITAVMQNIASVYKSLYPNEADTPAEEIFLKIIKYSKKDNGEPVFAYQKEWVELIEAVGEILGKNLESTFDIEEIEVVNFAAIKQYDRKLDIGANANQNLQELLASIIYQPHYTINGKTYTISKYLVSRTLPFKELYYTLTDLLGFSYKIEEGDVVREKRIPETHEDIKSNLLSYINLIKEKTDISHPILAGAIAFYDKFFSDKKESNLFTGVLNNAIFNLFGSYEKVSFTAINEGEITSVAKYNNINALGRQAIAAIEYIKDNALNIIKEINSQKTNESEQVSFSLLQSDESAFEEIAQRIFNMYSSNSSLAKHFGIVFTNRLFKNSKITANSIGEFIEQEFVLNNELEAIKAVSFFDLTLYGQLVPRHMFTDVNGENRTSIVPASILSKMLSDLRYEEKRKKIIELNEPIWSKNKLLQKGISEHTMFLGIEDDELEYSDMKSHHLNYKAYYSSIYERLFEKKHNTIYIQSFKSSNKKACNDILVDVSEEMKAYEEDKIKKKTIDDFIEKLEQELLVIEEKKLPQKEFYFLEYFERGIPKRLSIEGYKNARTEKNGKVKINTEFRNTIFSHFKKRNLNQAEKILAQMPSDQRVYYAKNSNFKKVLNDYKNSSLATNKNMGNMDVVFYLEAVYKWDLDTYSFGFPQEYKGDLAKYNKRVSITTSQGVGLNADPVYGLGEDVPTAVMTNKKAFSESLHLLGYTKNPLENIDEKERKKIYYDKYDGGAIVNPVFSKLFNLSSGADKYGFALTTKGSQKPVASYRDHELLNTYNIKFASFDILVSQIDEPGFESLKSLYAQMLGAVIKRPEFFHKKDTTKLSNLKIDKTITWYQVNNYIKSEMQKGKTAKEIKNPYNKKDEHYDLFNTQIVKGNYDEDIDTMIAFVGDETIWKSALPKTTALDPDISFEDVLKNAKQGTENKSMKSKVFPFKTKYILHQSNPHHAISEDDETAMATQILYLASTFSERIKSLDNKNRASQIYKFLYDIAQKTKELGILNNLPFLETENGKQVINGQKLLKTLSASIDEKDLLKYKEMVERGENILSDPLITDKILQTIMKTIEDEIVRLKMSGENFVLYPDMIRVKGEEGKFRDLQWHTPYFKFAAKQISVDIGGQKIAFTKEFEEKEINYKDIENFVFNHYNSQTETTKPSVGDMKKEALNITKSLIDNGTLKISKVGEAEIAIPIADKKTFNSFKSLYESKVGKFDDYNDNPSVALNALIIAINSDRLNNNGTIDDVFTLETLTPEFINKIALKNAEDKFANDLKVLYNFKCMIYGTGVRIPTSGKNNAIIYKVARFLNTNSNIVIAPSEIVKIHGSDYDIDKLKLFRKYGYEETEINAEDSANEKMGKEKRKQQNEILDILKTLLLDPVNVYELFTDIDFTQKNEFVQRYENMIGEKLKEMPLAFGSFLSDNLLHENNMVNLKLVGMFATFMKGMSYLIHAGAKIKHKNFFTGKDETLELKYDLDKRDLYYFENGNKTEIKDSESAKLIKYGFTYSNISIDLNAAIDAVKEMLHGGLNVTTENATLFSMLNMFRNPYFVSALFVQPSVRNIEKTEKRKEESQTPVEKIVSKPLVLPLIGDVALDIETMEAGMSGISYEDYVYGFSVLNQLGINHPKNKELLEKQTAEEIVEFLSKSNIKEKNEELLSDRFKKFLQFIQKDIPLIFKNRDGEIVNPPIPVSEHVFEKDGVYYMKNLSFQGSISATYKKLLSEASSNTPLFMYFGINQGYDTVIEQNFLKDHDFMNHFYAKKIGEKPLEKKDENKIIDLTDVQDLFSEMSAGYIKQYYDYLLAGYDSLEFPFLVQNKEYLEFIINNRSLFWGTGKTVEEQVKTIKNSIIDQIYKTALPKEPIQVNGVSIDFNNSDSIKKNMQKILLDYIGKIQFFKPLFEAIETKVSRSGEIRVFLKQESLEGKNHETLLSIFNDIHSLRKNKLFEESDISQYLDTVGRFKKSLIEKAYPNEESRVKSLIADVELAGQLFDVLYAYNLSTSGGRYTLNGLHKIFPIHLVKTTSEVISNTLAELKDNSAATKYFLQKAAYQMLVKIPKIYASERSEESVKVIPVQINGKEKYSAKLMPAEKNDPIIKKILITDPMDLDPVSPPPKKFVKVKKYLLENIINMPYSLKDIEDVYIEVENLYDFGGFFSGKILPAVYKTSDFTNDNSYVETGENLIKIKQGIGTSKKFAVEGNGLLTEEVGEVSEISNRIGVIIGSNDFEKTGESFYFVKNCN